MDPYVYPGTNVLRNLRDIRDSEILNEFEADATSRRIRQLEYKPSPGALDTRHLQTIHHHIFQDVYSWAGEFRTVNISRSGQFPFAFPEQIIPSLDRLSGELRKERYLVGADRSKFCNRGAHYLGELNAIHPFREGNGRTQRQFIRQLAGRNGYALDWSPVPRDQMAEASRQSFQRGDNAGLEKTLRSALGTGLNRARTDP
jgi:cell filamentation protein